AVLLGVLPFALLLVERLAAPARTDERPRRTSAVVGGALLLGLACGALAGTHLGQARAALAFVAGFAALRFAASRREPGTRARGVGIVGGLAFGALLALLVVAPMLHEAPRLSGPFGTSSAADAGGAIPQVFGSGFQPRLPDPTEFLGALRWNFFGRHYLGLASCLLACLGLLRIRRTSEAGRAGWRTLLVLAAAPWFMLAPSERGLDLIHIGGLLLAAGAVRGWSARSDGDRGVGDRGLRAATVLLIAFAVLDQLPIQALSSYTRTRDDRAEAYRLLETDDGGHRLVEFRTWPGSPLRGNIWSYAPTRRVPAAGGPFFQGAPREYWYTAAVIQTIGAKLAAGGKLDEDDARLLGFFDIGDLLFTKPLSEVVDPSAFAGEGWRVRPGDRALRVARASPVAVLADASVPSPALPADASLGVDGLATAHAEALAAEIRAWLTAADPRPVAGTRARVLPDRWELELPADEWGAVRLARNPYPSTVVEVDGAPVGWSPAPLGGILIRLEPGAHELVVRTGTPVAAACWWVGVVLSATAIAAAAVALRRSRPVGPRPGASS
ncbi:MAG: hypothetical protein Q7W29_00450, partial [bacterium]|nr:hypothetical protein [bacterium]